MIERNGGLMEDLISRQALCEYALNQKNKSVTPNDIMRFPSAQPETHEKRTETHGVCLDAISRQAAISVIAKWMLEYGGEGEECERNALKQAAEEIKELPSAQPDLDEVYAHAETEAEARFHAEIVRCKDCKYWREGTVYSYCDKLFGMGVLDVYDYMTDEDDYCSRAERKTDEKENI